MTEESILRARQNCCRLCLAPDSECISIFNSYAADKEPLANKIQSCVNIKVSPIDRLSLRICHACISYLNSWQSFKNRCVASQNKQRSWLDISKKFEKKQLSAAVSLSTVAALAGLSGIHEDGSAAGTGGVGGSGGIDDEQENSKLASSILEGISSLKKRRSLTVYPIPVHIKDEPIDDEEYDAKHDESDIDPTLFLERTEEEGSDNLSQKEQHLASLGLKQSSGSVHPLSYLADYSFEGDKSQQQSADKSADITTTTTPNEVKEASCRACNLKFSTRANARRHERNLHPHLFLGALPIITPPKPLNVNITSPMTQAIAASAPMAQIIPRPILKPEQLGLFDYDQPEKYQHLLSDDKILFMQRQEDFLQQYQNMTCNCCLRTHATYKNFMAHMRKKYHSLPRNLCFKCLKQNDSKALFISHLKKRNCINLYKVYHSLIDAGVMKKDASSCSPDKLRAKELLVNKIYECKICSKHYRLKLEFRSHVYEEHADYQKKDVSPGHCGFCGLEIEDPFERKRHYNNMDCIVILRCITCDEKFDNHQKFLDHVYSKHLANNNETLKSDLMKELPPPPPVTTSTDSSPSKKSEAPVKPQFFSRLPQSCNICGQHYNNYNNVLRHMESKHPDQLPQTYKCTRCLIGYPRLMNLREHMIEVHGMKVDKVRNNSFDYIVDSPTVQGSIPRGAEKGAVDSYTGRYDYVMKDLMSITNGGSAANEVGGENEDDDNKSDSPTPKKIKLDSGAVVAVGTASLKECPICSAVFNNNIGLSNHMRTHATDDGGGGGGTSGANASSSAVSGVGGVSGNAGGVVEDDGHDDDDDAADKKPIDPLFKRSLELAADRRFRRMRCRICQKRFSSKKSYRRHMLIDHQIRNVQFIKCKLCDAEFAYEKGLKVHMFKIHNTLLKDEMIVKQFECDICSIVYRTEEQLLLHKKSVHGNESAAAEDDLPPSVEQSMEATAAPVYWYQCRYCPSNFNTNKKLAIHINSHYEFDSNDYSCKDCGNVYSGRKSLWVHRYKKHPPVADPSECIICKKIFFDKQMLENHTQSCAQKRAAASAAESAPTYFQHKTGDDDEINDKPETSGSVGVDTTAPVNLKIKLPEVACTICAQKFTDQELFTKHIQMHEMELYTDNPLAAMFDTGPADPNQFYLDRVNDNGQYVCDICSKAFVQMTALKVHRKWHFRGDSKQTPVDSNAPKKTVKRKRELKCDYCPSTFISSNNLRRHIAELHKSEISNWPEPPKIEPEKYLQCTKCDLKFDTKKDWIDHKVKEAKIAKPFGPFQWGCEICGVYLSRREKLIHHMLAHIKEINGQVTSEADNYPGESNSQDSETSSHRGRVSEQPPADDDEAEEEDEDEEFEADEEDAEETVETENHDQNANDGQNDGSKLRERLQRESNDESNDSTTSSDSDNSSSDEEDGEDISRLEGNKKRHACDLCQVDFESSSELQKHVTSHFLNGPGSVTLTTITKEKSIPAQIHTKVEDDNDEEDEDDEDDDDNMTDADPVDS
ncbi:zinc finger protein hangover [Episyrphus balteatus]|uniref:zinc finger protein hangover n=1 Tax=Episyrphus balteatus TaxID=286459 RepID=UPI0024867DE5|nr:zinc finger protein hangover [Episyrphus balteatus]